jgi:DNA-binding FadR family transcriptional regulator
MEIAPEDLSRFFADLAPELDERRRRVLCGATARLLGRGGITAVSRAAGISRNTVAAGAAEIRAADRQQGYRIRRPGAGRKSAADREPQLLSALEALISANRQQPGGPGAPGAPLEWTLLSGYEIAAELRRQGFAISPSSVAQLMRGLGYFASGRARATSERKRAELNAQFRCLSDAAAAFGADGHQVISVRAGRSKPPAAPREPGPGEAAGADDGADRWIRVSADVSVVGFTVEAIQRWWTEVSPQRFPAAAKLLVCADTFGPEEDMRDAWKYHLTRLAHATGLDLTVQRIPAGAWRWRDREEQYSYSVVLGSSPGKVTRCEVTIDQITGLTAADLPRRAGTRPASRAAAGPRHHSGCGCQYTAHPNQVPARRGDAGPPARSAGVPAPRGAAARPAGAARAAGAEVPRHAAGRHGAHPAASHGLPDATEPRRPKIGEIVAHNIARDISTRRLRPGARLPSETVALTRFNVSRSSLREALRLLELLGVIGIRTGAGGGPVVGQVTSADFGTTTTFYYHLIGVTIRELLEARCILEPALVRLAVEAADPVAKGKLRAYMNNWGGDDALRPAWLAPGDRSRTAGFHRALIETGNAVLDLFSHSLQDVWTARQYMEPYPWQAAPHHDNDHWVIAQAILGNDGATAEGLMRTHMDYLYDFANAHWSGLMDEVIDWH